MKAILKNLFGVKRSKEAIIIVSGLPRSGTSMMMRMLEAGGVSILTDNIREADDDNPRGYYEFEKVKKIKEDSSWLEDCHGKAVKMVSALLFNLPPHKNYKVVFMKREMQEVLASQEKMLKRLGRNGADVSDGEMNEKFEKHLRQVESWLALQGNIDVLYISYNKVISQPDENARVINQFLGGRLNLEKMSEAVDRSLYRQRI
jgi:hypothetical protein